MLSSMHSDNEADAYSPLSALAKRQSRLSLHGRKLIDDFHTKFRSLIGFLCILLITVTDSNDTPSNCKKG